jgi:hypothetical protein
MHPLSGVAASSATQQPMTFSSGWSLKYAVSWCHGFSDPMCGGLSSPMSWMSRTSEPTSRRAIDRSDSDALRALSRGSASTNHISLRTAASRVAGSTSVAFIDGSNWMTFGSPMAMTVATPS